MKKSRAPKLVTVAIFTTMTIIFWIFYGLYDILSSPVTLTIPNELLNPISATLDTNTLRKINGRIFFEEGDVNFSTTPVTVSGAGSQPPEPTPTEIPENNDEDIETATPTATLAP